MTDDRKKVKDLAVELGMQPKDLLVVAKELGINNAKVAASNLSDLEASRLRNHITSPADKRENVIVRRRKPASPESAATAAPESEETQASAVVEDVASSTDVPADKETMPKPAKVEKTPAPQARIIRPAAAPPAEPVARKEEEAPADLSREQQEPEQKPATVVTAPEVSSAATAPAQTDLASAGKSGPEKSGSDQATKEQARRDMPRGESGRTEAGRKEHGRNEPGRESGRTAQPVTDQAKKAGQRASYSAEPDKNASGQTISSAPSLPAQTAEAATTGSSVRVISRPVANAPAPGVAAAPAGAPGGNRGTTEPRRPGAAPSRPGERNFTGQRPNAAPRPDTRRPSAPAGAAGPAAAGPMGGEDAESRNKKRQKGRKTVDFSANFGKRNEEDAGWSKASGRRKPRHKPEPPKGGTQPQKAVKRKIKVEEFIRVADLAHQMGLKSGEIIKILFNLGVMATINQSLDIETATLVSMEYGYEIEKVGFSEEEVIEAHQADDAPEDLKTRPPVVTIMGHVDHGKTSLLDAIRKSSVVSGEAGGITQHIGAYHVKTKKGEIVFLDTPGHEAFTAMRARGAEVTDLVVLVVAADDGVMEQTKEAINHSKAANVPIMVAVNKIDKPGAEPDRVKRELADQGLVAEDWGGETVFVHVSAKQRIGLDDLLELLALQAEVLELKANPNKPARGHIVEAKLDKGRGALGTILIQEGTLRQGDAFVCGVHSGRVRAMFNDQGKKVKEATPSMPVEVQGFEGVPEAGEEFICLPDEKTARRIAEARHMKQRERDLARESKVTLETFLASRADDFEAAVLKLVVKSDVQGSHEAIIDAVNKLSTEKVRIQVIHGGTGAISESDILLATASNAIVLGFNVRPTSKAKELAEAEKVEMRFYDIIYKLVDEIKSAMEGMLAPVEREVILGSADVRETFSVPKVGVIAGSHISDGKVVRNAAARLLRDGVVIHTGKISSLRRFKDDVREVLKGYECGISLENYNDIKVGDTIEAFEIVEEAAKL